jgi:hypothetical protein
VAWLHFGVSLPSRDCFAHGLPAMASTWFEEWDEPEYVSAKCRDRDGYIVEAAWEPEHSSGG